MVRKQDGSRRVVRSVALDFELIEVLAALADEHEGNASMTVRHLIRAEAQRRVLNRLDEPTGHVADQGGSD